MPKILYDLCSKINPLWRNNYFQAVINFLKKDIVIFIIVFTALLIKYDYHQTSFMAPQGLHQWRQCVGAAYAMNYYNYDLDITEPRIYCHISQGGTSDKTIAECPIIYYLIAVFYKIFGNDDAIFRIVNALILLIGLFYLFKASRLLLGDKFWSLLLPVLLFTSPTLIYYGNSFLPDTSAFGLVFISLYLIVLYTQKPKLRYLYFAALIFAIAGLFKITSLISYLAISGTFVLMWIFSKSFRQKVKILKILPAILVPVVMVLGWYYFVSYYNRVYGGTISPVAIRPIWILDERTISITWDRIINEWINSYIHSSVQIFTLAVFITTLIFFKKTNRFITVLSILTLVGGTAFFFLFFRSLHQHDYYLINVTIVVVFILVNGLLLLKQYAPWLFKFIILKLAVIYVVLLFTNEAVDRVKYKYHSYYNDGHRKLHYGFVDIEDYNRSLGIKQKDLVVSLPDGSMNISLYLMNQPGYTAYGFANLSGKERMDFLIEKGAKYLFISDSGLFTNESYDYLEPYLQNKIGSHENITIFDLRNLNLSD